MQPSKVPSKDDIDIVDDTLWNELIELTEEPWHYVTNVVYVPQCALGVYLVVIHYLSDP